MTVYGYAGQIVHHNNCTYCVHRQALNAGDKRKKRELEKCRITGLNISPPGSLRYCDHYQQIDCICPRCGGENVADQHQLDITLDSARTM